MEEHTKLDAPSVVCTAPSACSHFLPWASRQAHRRQGRRNGSLLPQQAPKSLSWLSEDEGGDGAEGMAGRLARAQNRQWGVVRLQGLTKEGMESVVRVGGRGRACMHVPASSR